MIDNVNLAWLPGGHNTNIVVVIPPATSMLLRAALGAVVVALSAPESTFVAIGIEDKGEEEVGGDESELLPAVLLFRFADLR